MKIKNKLIANVLFKLLIVLAILLTGLFSIGFLQEKISYLTNQSTPLQIHIIEQQHWLQSAYSALLKVANSQNMQEFTLSRIDASTALEKTIDKCNIHNHQANQNHDLHHQELFIIANQLFNAVENRIKSDQTVTDTNTNILRSINIVSSRLDEHNNYIHQLQTSNAGAFTASLANTTIVAERLRSIEELRNHIRELQLITVGMQNVKSKTAVLIARAKLNALVMRINKNAYYNNSPNTASMINDYSGLLASFSATLHDALQADDQVKFARAEEHGKDLPYKLNDLFQILDQEAILARDELNVVSAQQENRFTLLLKANESLKTSSDLVELGLLATAKTHNLPSYELLPELERQTAEINELFKSIHNKINLLKKYLAETKAEHELHLLQSVVTAVKTMSGNINSETGVFNALKQKLYAKKQANDAIERLNSIIFQQTLAGDKQLTDAAKEQENAVTQVDKQVVRSRYFILTMGLTAIAFAFFFSFWIYLSVIPSLGAVLAAIRAQKEQGREQAELAKAVADGDFDREITVSPPIVFKNIANQDDEISSLLFAVGEMNSSQIMLDQALGNMTTALRVNRNAEAARYKIQQGLHELDKILRTERNLKRLAEQVLNFLADFTGAAVGIIYSYNHVEKSISPLSFHAVSGEAQVNRSFALGEGLAGQAALERKTLLISCVPGGYLPFSSALGSADPLQIVVLPVLHQDRLLGVLELGSFNNFDERQMEFLQQALEAVAVSFAMATFK